ncbi:hypothetical protein GCM10028796_43780 [Ramlibacter monticola]|uniref:Lipoprotein n=2 Tax=Ramlibacter monticola TaxID=1926872 RepID=A0A936Z3K2_9BURK|nr:hypothetical protein [Ramlibacter monticola]
MQWLVSTRLAGIILALAAALALVACSAVKLGYANLPHLAWWWLDGYADFSDEQEPAVRDAIASLYTWHRQDELPRVAELLGRMEQMAPGEITPQQACSVLKEVQDRLGAVGRHVEPTAVALAAKLTPRQLRHIQRKFRSNNESFRRDWIEVSPEEQRDKRYKQMLDRMQTVYGTLDEPQRRILRQRLSATLWDPHRMLAQWQRRQQDLLQILARLGQPGLAPAEAGALLRGWFEALERPADPAYRAYQDALLQEGCATFAAVHQGTTAAQREQAEHRLRGWQRDLRELSAQQP